MPPETHCHFCGVLAKNAEPELHEETPHKSDIGTLLNNWLELFKKCQSQKIQRELRNCSHLKASQGLPGQSSGSTAKALGSIPGRGTKTPQAAWCGQKNK